MQELLLNFCWANRNDLSCTLLSSFSFWSIHKIIVRIGVARLVLKLCEEEVVAPSGITNAIDGRSAIVTTELLLPLFPDFGIRRLWASPSFAVENVTESRLEFDLPSDADVVKKKGVDDFRVSECSGIKLESIFSEQVKILPTCIFH